MLANHKATFVVTRYYMEKDHIATYTRWKWLDMATLHSYIRYTSTKSDIG